MKIRKRLTGATVFVLFSALAIAGCWSPQSAGEQDDSSSELPPFGVITTQQAVDVILALQSDPEFVLLDIRTPAEVEAGHISGAIAFDFYSDTFRDDLAALDRDLTYLIYCRTGNRTGQAYGIMDELGFEQVFDMGGGISQWIAAEYPVCLGPLDAEHSCSGELPQS
ncbi:rhodanese-like domain-containing protein [Candidatus Bipolaricaulota bacterium]